MARQRFIWPDLWDDPDLGRLPPLAQLLYIGCFSLADDDGRLIGEPESLKASVFRYRKIPVAEVAKLRGQVAAACSNFRVYDVEGTTYIAFLNWATWQKPKYPKPSKIPPPPKPSRSRKPAQSRQKSSGNDSGKPSGKPSGSDSPVLEEPLPHRVGLGREVLKTPTCLPTSKEDPAPADPDPPRVNGHTKPGRQAGVANANTPIDQVLADLANEWDTP